ncbi:hypothetical protein [Bradyrhizobium sp. LVM 105]|uniref:hypothetical protein n=1 Tax=Bradyrhizobium sp. LVM 105 TaxID=2341115 RepID=UPI000F806B47|nr:hypothetical protein [Bradyrhizobium sp. LVM 105]RTE92750.1 hypothetical protein D6B98_14805 [Bradyrhizobium sp. LVM 105]
MNNEDAIIARLAGLEAMACGCFTFLLASAGNDPDASKAKAILDVLRADADRGMAHLPDHIQAEAKAYLTTLTKQVLENLRALRGGPTRPQ